MNLLILLALAFTVGGSSSYYITTAIDAKALASVRAELEAYKLEAATTLNEEHAKRMLALDQALELNKQLDTANEQATNSINTLYSKLSRLQLKPQKALSSSCPKTASHSPVQSPAKTKDDELSTRLHEFSTEQFYVADQLEAYAQECWKFVVENNCGIAK